MAALSGKMTALVIFVLLVVFLAFVLTPLALAPLGVFTGLARGWDHITINGFNLRPWFPFVPIWSVSFIFFVIWIVVIVWVYKDAEERRMSGVLWALLVFIGNLIGLIIYLIVRQDHPIPTRGQVATSSSPAKTASSSTITCPSCQKSVEKSFAFCPHCGAVLQPVCRSCGKPVEAGWKVCPHCGGQLKTE
jgi:RNA polymerase subunit RPABC4/transcription elongation factor Spt4